MLEPMEPRYVVVDTTDPHWVEKYGLDNIIKNLRAKEQTQEVQENLAIYLKLRARHD